MIDVTLACEDYNLKLVDVVTVAEEDRVGNNLLQIWKLRFGQDSEVEVQARFEAGVWSVFFLLMFCRGYVELKLNLGRYSEARFGQDFEV